MKKKLLYLCTCFCLLGVGILLTSMNSKIKDQAMTIEKLESEASAYPEIYDHINSVSYNNFDKLIHENEQVVYIGRPTCTDCTVFEPELIEYIEDEKLHSKMVYLNTARIRDDDNDWETFKATYSIDYTPTLALFKNGQLIDKAEWTPENGFSMDNVRQFMKANGIV